jgi:uncharacterized membrane protein YdjX (TVP38/TMEM64 family)
MGEQKAGGAGAGAIAWIVLAVCASAGLYYAAATGAISWTSLMQARAALNDWIGQSPALVVALYVAAFMTLSLILFPAQLWIILVGGVLFGFETGFAISWACAIASSLIVFSLSRTALGGLYRRRAGRYLERVSEIFHRDQVWYMLTLRLIPICPYCVANVLPAMLGARLWPYLLATVIGVVPYILVYSFVGSRAGALLAVGEPPDFTTLSREFVWVFAALASLPLLAIGARYAFLRRRTP